MNHIIKFSTNYNFYAFSKKYKVSLHKYCLNHQSFSSNQCFRYKTLEQAVLKEIKSQKPVKGHKRRLKKTDLLKVTKTSATQKQMTVGKLKASQITAFAVKPGMVFENLHELEHRKKTYPYKQEVANENEMEDSVKPILKFMNQRVLTENHMGESQFQTVCNLTSDYRFNNRFWVSYIDVCLNGNLSQIALQVLHASGKNSLTYEALFTNFVKKKECTDYQVIKLFDVKNVVLTPKIVVLYLDCLSRSNGGDDFKRERTKHIIDQYLSSGKKLDDISNEAELYYMKNVVELMRKVYPDVEDVGPETGPLSSCPLIERLYKSGNYKVSPSHPEINKEEFLKLAKEQIDMELSSYVEIDRIFPRSKSVNKCAREWENLMKVWEVKLRENFVMNLERSKSEFVSDNLKIYPFLNSVSVDEAVKLMLEEIELFCLRSELYTCSLGFIYRSVGQRLWERYSIKINYSGEALKKYESFLNKYLEWYSNPDGSNQNYRQKWQNMMWEYDDKSTLNELNISWKEDVKEKVGKFICDIIFKSAVIPSSFLPKRYGKNDVPGFYVVYRNGTRGFMELQMKYHPCLRNLYNKAKSNKLFFSVKHLPMVSPPKPWTSIYNGGLYILPSRFLRLTQRDYSLKALSRFPNRSLYSIFDSLNQLQSVAWVMNTEVLDVAIEVFKKGGSKELDVPINPDSIKIPQSSQNKNVAYWKALQRKQELYGLWCECLYKLSLANHFRNRTFWLPYNLDFRGRVYPIPPHVSHICADLYRSLFKFAKKKSLGPKGLDWLKIHCINLCGSHKKKSISQRLMYANEVMPEILDSAEKPLDGRRWWVKAEDPWQTLATCMEIRNALKSGNPETYETGLPVHQDGSCNGLQHYAALGRDPTGAASVNLAPSEFPQDVYEVVVNIVEGLRKKDEENGVEIAQALNGFVIRKIIKQTVMTTVYGVTLFGAKTQIANKLKNFNEFPPEQINSASMYLTHKIFEALNEMFTSAQELQTWFANCASIITSKLGKHVTWVTPLGLPVVQPYFREKYCKNSGNKFLPSTRKQKNAFPPNFVHSLDSSHMMLTGLTCGMNDITFASIHDCFWTHPSDINAMNGICRSKFIELHSENIIDNLAQHFLQTYITGNEPNKSLEEAYKMFRSVPKKGKFNLNDVAKSIYFFS